jgi:hypothetical protein
LPIVDAGDTVPLTICSSGAMLNAWIKGSAYEESAISHCINAIDSAEWRTYLALGHPEDSSTGPPLDYDNFYVSDQFAHNANCPACGCDNSNPASEIKTACIPDAVTLTVVHTEGCTSNMVGDSLSLYRLGNHQKWNTKRGYLLCTYYMEPPHTNPVYIHFLLSCAGRGGAWSLLIGGESPTFHDTPPPEGSEGECVVPHPTGGTWYIEGPLAAYSVSWDPFIIEFRAYLPWCCNPNAYDPTPTWRLIVTG